MANTTESPTAADVRAWANENGFEVGKRGYLAAEVVAAFNKGKRGRSKYTPVRAAA